MSLIKNLTIALPLITAFGLNTAHAASSTPEQLKQDFIETQQKQGFSKSEINDFLNSATKNQTVLKAIAKPWEAKPWYQYYPIFLTEKRLQAGLKFWKENDQTITKAAAEFNVEPQIIVAIIGVETFYGSYLGKYSVVDALYSLGFYYPPRATFFRSEFGKLMELIKTEKLDPKSLKGSYAGAMGYGQFIPSSYLAYAVDFDNDGKRDLINSKADAIASVANYFHQHGWQQNQPIAFPLKTTTTPTTAPWKKGRIQHKVSDILSTTVKLENNQTIDTNQPALLVELEQEDAKEYWLGLNNFYVITRYNHSPLYAMAVYQFSEQLKQHYVEK